MCGIAGLVDTGRRLGPEALEAGARAMADVLVHRGPDAGEVWADPAAGIALGHRRLAIIDLSAEGRQPMHSASGRYVIAYNGEIYNFRALRQALETADEPVRFRGHSDTEVLLAAVERFGLERTLEQVVGMFAFALWDRHAREIHLVRDRLGKKPLYVGWVGEHFLFASELKAFHCHPDFTPKVNRAALVLMLRHSCVPAPHTIFENVFKLPPASRLSLRPNGSNAPRGEALLELVEPYWSALEVAQAGLAEPFRGSEEDALEELDAVLSEAVGERMVSDVPLGAFLSGGVDSSLVVALMQKQSARPVRTFSIGFHEQEFDEAAGAEAVARRLGTEHTELYVTPEEARAVIPDLPTMYDEPFSDQSAVPTFLVARMAREHVTVALSGDGGDEVFGGYQRHYRAGLIERLSLTPVPLRSALAWLVMQIPPAVWDAVLGHHTLHFSDKVHKLADILEDGHNADALYLRMTSHWMQPADLVLGAREPATLLNDPTRRLPIADFATRMMALDAVTFLPDDILTKVDRASMAVSLEARAPLLDQRVFAFAWRLPKAFKVKEGEGKWILRRLLERYVPKALVERPKHGFGIPVGTWLSGPLRDWAEALLAEDRLRREGFFAPQPIRHAWKEHLNGRRNFGYHLWDVLMFQAWQDQWLR